MVNPCIVIECSKFENSEGAQCEYTILLDSAIVIANFCTIKDNISVEDCAKRTDQFVSIFKRVLNNHVAVDIKRVQKPVLNAEKA